MSPRLTALGPCPQRCGYPVPPIVPCCPPSSVGQDPPVPLVFPSHLSLLTHTPLCPPKDCHPPLSPKGHIPAPPVPPKQPFPSSPLSPKPHMSPCPQRHSPPSCCATTGALWVPRISPCHPSLSPTWPQGGGRSRSSPRRWPRASVPLGGGRGNPQFLPRAWAPPWEPPPRALPLPAPGWHLPRVPRLSPPLGSLSPGIPVTSSFCSPCPQRVPLLSPECPLPVEPCPHGIPVPEPAEGHQLLAQSHGRPYNNNSQCLHPAPGRNPAITSQDTEPRHSRDGRLLNTPTAPTDTPKTPPKHPSAQRAALQ